MTFTFARFLTTPRSSHNTPPLTSASAGIWSSFSYVAVPEKYFTPLSACSGQEISRWSVTDAGAPQFGGKLSFQPPSTAIGSPTATSRCFGVTTWSVVVSGSRKTTNTEPLGSNSSGTITRPPLTAYAGAGSIFPVSGCQSSGFFPQTRNEHSCCTNRSAWLERK